MASTQPHPRPQGVPLTAVLLWMLAIEAVVVWVFAGVLFPGMM